MPWGPGPSCYRAELGGRPRRNVQATSHPPSTQLPTQPRALLSTRQHLLGSASDCLRPTGAGPYPLPPALQGFPDSLSTGLGKGGLRAGPQVPRAPSYSSQFLLCVVFSHSAVQGKCWLAQDGSGQRAWTRGGHSFLRVLPPCTCSCASRDSADVSSVSGVGLSGRALAQQASGWVPSPAL